MIPKLIHHVWPGQDPFRAEFHRFRRSFLDQHPDWSLRFWRDDLGPQASAGVRAVLADPRYSAVIKSDVVRYEVLRLYGGVYVDTDVECLRPFDDLLEDAFFCGRESQDVLCPSVLGCVPGHPLAALLARKAVARLGAVDPAEANARPHQITGPSLLTELARGREDVHIHPEAYFYPIPWWDTAHLASAAPGAYAKH